MSKKVEKMIKKVSQVALRLMAATLFLILFNTLGTVYGIQLPINLFNVIVLAGFGILGFVALILLGFMI